LTFGIGILKELIEKIAEDKVMAALWKDIIYGSVNKV